MTVPVYDTEVANRTLLDENVRHTWLLSAQFTARSDPSALWR